MWLSFMSWDQLLLYWKLIVTSNFKFLVLAQDEADKKGLSQKEVADNNQGNHEIDVLSMHDLGPC